MRIYIDENFITDNSNECEKNCYFLKTFANEKFSDDALKNGAKIINVDECKKILAIDESIKIIGITGTNGKTTTAALIYQTLLNLGFSCGLCGTRGAFINGKRVDEKSLTTSPILKTLEYLSLATRQKCEFFVMEVSSHAIVQNRIQGLKFAAKIFTNLSQDHLDYHKTMDEYIRVKNSFLADESVKIINIDDDFVRFNPKNSLTYSLKKPADITAKDIDFTSGIHAILSTKKGDLKIDSNLQGEFNLYNLMAAVGVILALSDKKLDEISAAIANFSGVSGRVEVVSKDPLVIVDFAHTPDGILKILNALRHLSLVVVFGAGGDRDRTKRPKMGAIAQKYARLCVVTSDNPRSENPDAIIAEILSGMSKENVIVNSDRYEAIRLGLNNLRPNEALVILGKGDEDYQEINGVKHPFSDKNVVLELLKG